MNAPFNQSKAVKPLCLVCQDNFIFKPLVKGVCLKCWGWSAVGRYIDATKKLLKSGEDQ